MRRPRQMRTILALAAMAAVVAGGCRTAQIEQHSYQYKILSEPEGAAVLDDSGRRMGSTPMSVERHFEIKHEEVPESVGMGATFGGVAIMGLGGWLMGDTLSSEDPGLGLLTASALSIFAGMTATTLGAVAWSGMFDGTSYRGAGARAWTPYRGLEKPTRQQVRDELFYSDFVVTAPGHQELKITPREGQALFVALARAGSGGHGSVTLRPLSESSSPKQFAKDTQINDDGVPADFLTASPQPTAFALVVGVEDYRDIPDAVGARADAERFAEMLETSMGVPPQNIRLLTDAHATRTDILAHAKWLEANVPEGSRIYFYFGGHGTPDVATGESHILPFEATHEMLAASGLELSAVLERLGQSQAKEVLAFVDSCFAGSGGRSILPEGTRPLVPVKAFTKEPSVALFSAARSAQISGNLPGADAGLFTHHVLEALGKGRADADGNGQVTLSELKSFVQPRVERIARESSRAQTPQLTVADELGDIDNVVVTWGLPLR